MVRPERFELEPFCGRERRQPSRSPQAKSRTRSLGEGSKMVRPERFELPAWCFGGNRSIQLSYGRTSVASIGYHFRPSNQNQKPKSKIHRKGRRGRKGKTQKFRNFLCFLRFLCVSRFWVLMFYFKVLSRSAAAPRSA